MSFFTKPGSGSSGGGMSPAEYDALTQDGELSASRDAILTRINQGVGLSVSANEYLRNEIANITQAEGVALDQTQYALLVAALGRLPGQTAMVTNTTGQAPSGSTRVSGLFVPTTLFSSSKFAAISGLTANTYAFNVNSHSTLFYIAGGGCYGLNLGTLGETAYLASPITSPAVLSADDLYVYEFASTSQAVANVNRLTLASNSWGALLALPAVRMSPSGCRLYDGRHLLVGGSSSASVSAATLTNTVWIYDPATNSYAVKAAAPFRSYDGRCTLLSDGRVLFAFPTNRTSTDGATLASGYTRLAVYDPVADTWQELDNSTLGACLPVLRADGRVLLVPLGAAAANAQLLDLSAAPGSQLASAPLATPGSSTGPVNLSVNARASVPVVQANEQYQPFSTSGPSPTFGLLYYLGATDATTALNTFYVSAN